MNRKDADRNQFEADVQAEVEKRMAQQQALFAKTMEQAMKASLQSLDDQLARLEKERKAVEKELDAARAEREKAELEGEKMVQAYFEERRAALIEFTQKEQLRLLVQTHLEAGRSVDDICLWLGVTRDFVEGIAKFVGRMASPAPTQKSGTGSKMAHNPRLRYGSQGRGGTIWFESDQASFSLWWEFGGGNALAVIEIPTEATWQSRTQLPLDQRDEVLQFIAEQIVQDQTFGDKQFEISDAFITIFR